MLRQADNIEPSPVAPVAFGIISHDLDEHTSLIAVEGELDLSTAPQLKWALVDALGAGHSQLVLDLSRSSFMDSTALGVLIGVNRSLDVGSRLAIACAHPNVLNVFELSGMDGAFAIFSSMGDALAYIQQPAPEAR